MRWVFGALYAPEAGRKGKIYVIFNFNETRPNRKETFFGI